MTAAVYDPTPCALGEGALWHPERGEFFWFDVLRYRLHARMGGATRTWQFDEHVSAAGWIDGTRFLVASETGLFVFDIETGQSEPLVPLEADRPDTRSNDGRTDPWGGFWIGTMSKTAEEGAGAIYRYYRGALRRLYPGVTIPNAICFAPDGAAAYFADTRTRHVMRQRLSAADGWPEGDPELYLDLAAEGLNPDGAVIDGDGNFWNAQWGAGRVACYAPDGRFLKAVEIGSPQASCPAFGDPDGRTLFCTTARSDLPREVLDDGRAHGAVYSAPDIATGQAEHRVIL